MVVKNLTVKTLTVKVVNGGAQYYKIMDVVSISVVKDFQGKHVFSFQFSVKFSRLLLQ